MPTKSLRFETRKEPLNDTRLFKEVEYEGVKIYVHKALRLNKNAKVFQKLKLPLLGIFWGYEGISF